ncbi:MAG TPA: ChbG/HpnK family deacetylase [Conexibacter sp.]|nr:ChbG/HpnK family deacetylase [Conexibacter sp.]
MSDRVLIVNADDLGASAGTNAGIVRAHEHGIVTSASLMVDGPAAEAAARYARAHASLSVGLHLDLGEWVHRDGQWIVRYERTPAEREIPRQLERFRALVGRDPTHLDSHQHVHREEPAASLMGELAARLGVPLRGCGAIAYRGDFYGQTGKGEPLPELVTAAALVAVVERLPAGVTELGCHPGLDTALDSDYRLERLAEVEALCDPRVRAALAREEVELRGFAAASHPWGPADPR